jgi:hypothetical protein
LFQARSNGVALQLDQGPYAALFAETIKDPDEIWVDWAAVGTGVALRRTYFRRIVLASGEQLIVSFQWTKAGWVAKASFSGDRSALETARKGALLYRRN